MTSKQLARNLEATCEQLERHWKQIRGFGRRWTVQPHLEARYHLENCVIRNQATMQVVCPTAKVAHLVNMVALHDLQLHAQLQTLCRFRTSLPSLRALTTSTLVVSFLNSVCLLHLCVHIVWITTAVGLLWGAQKSVPLLHAKSQSRKVWIRRELSFMHGGPDSLVAPSCSPDLPSMALEACV
jgi:hypothetical protein